MRRGIVLAGGKGTRLYPLTLSVSKHLMPVYDKPLIYYPLSVLMLAGIREILLITNPGDREAYERLFGDGKNWGVTIQYAVQQEPEGIAQTFLIARDFIRGNTCALILGDNIFYGDNLGAMVRNAASCSSGATAFAYWVNDPERYGVVEFDAKWQPTRITEKPKNPKSNYALTGLYFYDENAYEVASSLAPSCRGELEITDMNSIYLERNSLHVERFGRGYAWLDAGTPDSLLEASLFVQTVEKRQGLKIACPEEIAFRMDFIDRKQLERLVEKLKPNDYSRYLTKILSAGQT